MRVISPDRSSSAGMLSGWGALEKWPHMRWWKAAHGHRTVPLEIGRYGQRQWHEAVHNISDFIDQYMVPSIERDIACEAQWLQDSTTRAPTQVGASQTANDTVCDACRTGSDVDFPRIPSPGNEYGPSVAYMAQHRMFEQIPELLDDLSEPPLWTKGYEVMNMWMGTRGTVRCCCVMQRICVHMGCARLLDCLNVCRIYQRCVATALRSACNSLAITAITHAVKS